MVFFKYFLNSLEEHLLPRYFAVYKDGSAEELLREEDYSGFLREAEKDPMVAVLKPVEQRENSVTGITILRPFKGKFVFVTSKEYESCYQLLLLLSMRNDQGTYNVYAFSRPFAIQCLL